MNLHSVVLDLKISEFPNSYHGWKQDAVRKMGSGVFILEVNEREIRPLQPVLVHVSRTY